MSSQVFNVIANTERQVNQAILYMAKRNAVTGAPFGFLPIGVMSPGLNATITIEFEEIPDTGGTVRVNNAIKIATSKTGQISGTVVGLKPALRRALFYGTDVAIAAGSAVVDTVWAEKGQVLALNNMKMSALISVTGVGGTPTYTDTGTLNADFGALILPDTGDLATAIDAETAMADGIKRLQVEVTYDHDAYTLTRGLLNDEEEFWVRLELLEANGAKAGILNAFRCSLNPASSFPLISNVNESSKFDIVFDVLSDGFRAADPLMHIAEE